MVNYKAYKIIGKYEEPAFGFIMFELADYIDLGERYGRQMKGKGYIQCADHPPYSNYEVGDWLEVDLDRIGDKKNGTITFDDTSIVRKVGSSSAVVPRNNNSNLINQNQQGTAIQMLNRAIDSDPRNKYTASMEVDPKTGKINYHLSGERK